jgi:hypothetical protein
MGHPVHTFIANALCKQFTCTVHIVPTRTATTPSKSYAMSSLVSDVVTRNDAFRQNGSECPTPPPKIVLQEKYKKNLTILHFLKVNEKTKKQKNTLTI